LEKNISTIEELKTSMDSAQLEKNASLERVQQLQNAVKDER